MKNKLNGTSKLCFLFFLLPVVLYVSCSNSPRNRTTDSGKNDYMNTIQLKPPSSFSNTITINFPAAVFYNPDTLQLEKIKAITDTMTFESTMHDCFYQMRNSRIVIKQYYPRIKIIEVKNARYLLFEKAGGEKECIDLNTKNDPCGVFFFDGQRAPRLVDMTNIESELGFYFSKQISFSMLMNGLSSIFIIPFIDSS